MADVIRPQPRCAAGDSQGRRWSCIWQGLTASAEL